jgi:hypothetical protein
MTTTDRTVEPGGLVDQLALRDVICALSLEGDTGALDAYGALFAEEAVLESPAGVLEGRTAILESAEQRCATGTTGPGSGARHHVVPGIVTVEGDRARSRSCFAFYAQDDGAPRVAIIGEYHDEFRRDGSAWVVIRRTVLFG